MMLAMVAVMYFFIWRPESKRRKEMTKFREGLKKGDKVIISKYSGTEVKLDGNEYTIVRQADILAVVED